MVSINDPLIQNDLHRLEGIFRAMDSVLVAFSGGIDSTLVLKVAHDVLGDRSAAATSVSPAVSAEELSVGRRIAGQIGAAHHFVVSQAMDRPQFYQNGPKRCYTCKQDLYSNIARLAREMGFRWLANGTNPDDLNDVRPGLQAAREFGVRSPLIEAGLGKAGIRRLSRALGLANWDKPAEACLSSRVPFGTTITMERLDQIERAERSLKAEGFRQVRVRHHGEVARVEIPPEDFCRLMDAALRARLVEAVRKTGFRYVALDLEGYRQGSLNRSD